MAAWEKNVRRVIPYTPGEQPNRPNMIKLNTNENPYPPSPAVAKVLQEMEVDSLRRYPDPAAGDWFRLWRIITRCRISRYLWGWARMMYWQ